MKKTFSKAILLITLLVFTFAFQSCTGSGNWSLPGSAFNSAPVVVIAAPLGGSMVREGANITFAGSAEDPDEGALSGGSLAWTSDQDGQIGTGQTFDITALSRSTHIITLTATDTSGAQGTATVVVSVIGAWFDDQWGYRQQITISASMANADLMNFPALIKITDQNNPLFDRAQTDGDDIYFTEDDGISQLAHELEYFQTTPTKELDAWVRIPNLSSTADTIIYMYYGNPGVAVSNENPTSVWDSNFTMVHHLQETSGAHLDSTSRGNDYPTVVVTAQGTAPGKINGADEFDGIDDSVTWGQLLRNLIDRTAGVGTMEVWMRPAGAPVAKDDMWDLPAAIGDNWGSTGIFRGIYPTGGEDRIWLSNWIGGLESCFVGTTYNVDEWTYIVWLKTADTLYIYKDGVETGSVPCVIAGDGRLMIGRNWPGGTSFNGLVDEVRTSNIDRSPDWIETSFSNQDNPGSFLTFNAEEVN